MGVTSKGQVTIPVAVRRKLKPKPKPGDRVRFVEENGQIVLKPVLNDIRAAFGIIKGKRSVTLEEMQEAIEQTAAERFLQTTRGGR